MCSKMQIGNIHSFIHSSTPSLMLDGFANLVCFSCVGLDRAGLVGLMWDQMNGEKRKVRVFGPTPPSTDQDTEAAQICGRICPIILILATLLSISFIIDQSFQILLVLHEHVVHGPVVPGHVGPQGGPTRGRAAYSNSRRPPRVRAAALWRRRGRNGSFASSQLELGSGGKDGVVEQT